MAFRVLALPFAALTIGACNLFNGKCTYETRGLQLAGQVPGSGGALLAAAEANVSESRGSLQGSSIYWVVTGTTLKGHVLSASLKDASDPSHALLDLPLASAERSVITEGETNTVSGADLSGFYNILSAGRGIIELKTDASSSSTITIVLVVTSSHDWTRPYCS